jgi:hypothetical protein
MDTNKSLKMVKKRIIQSNQTIINRMNPKTKMKRMMATEKRILSVHNQFFDTQPGKHDNPMFPTSQQIRDSHMGHPSINLTMNHRWIYSLVKTIFKGTGLSYEGEYTLPRQQECYTSGGEWLCRKKIMSSQHTIISCD